MRTFDATELTIQVVNALNYAAESLHQQNHLIKSLKIRDQANEFQALASKIKSEKLDIRLTPREE